MSTSCAQDADGDPIRYALAAGEPDMQLTPDTARLTWTPGPEDVSGPQVDAKHIVIVATDARGASTSQEYFLRVVEESANHRPLITSRPRLTTGLGATYYYQVEALDPDGDPLMFSLVNGPAGMTMNADGLVRWIPSSGQLGLHQFTVEVSDGRDGFEGQIVPLTVVSQHDNLAPLIVSTPPMTATVGNLYAYNLEAADPEGDALLWNLDFGPTGMSLDATLGTLRWQPTINQLGMTDVVVTVTDAYGGRGTQRFTLNVRSVNLPPQISSTPPTIAFVDHPYLYAVRAVDPDGAVIGNQNVTAGDTDPLAYRLDAAPENMSMNAAGIIRWNPSPEQGDLAHRVVVVVEDNAGARASQEYYIYVNASDVVANSPPVIQSTPEFQAEVGSSYEYQIIATDADGDVLRYFLDAASRDRGMQIDTTGLIQWTPQISHVGVHSVLVTVLDPSNVGSAQEYSVRVVELNSPPEVQGEALINALAGRPYLHDIVVTDPDNDPLTFNLVTGPNGMHVNEFGQVTWFPTFDDVTGDGELGHLVEVAVSDGRFVLTLDWRIEVVGDEQPPRVGLGFSDNPVDADSTVTIFAAAVDNIGVDSITVTINGSAVPLDGNNSVTLTAQIDAGSGVKRLVGDAAIGQILANASGHFDVIADATDFVGNTSQASLDLFVTDPNDEAPFVDLVSPPLLDDMQHPLPITGPIEVVGSVTDDNLSSYSLTLLPFESSILSVPAPFATGTEPVDNGTLGLLDPTSLANGTYTLRLTAQDDGGHISSVEVIVDIAGDLKLGNFTLSFTDLTVPVSGIPVVVSRTYDTLDASQQNDFGFGWRMEIRDTDLITSVPATGLEEEYSLYNPFFFGTRIYVTTPGVGREAFTFRPQLARGLRGSLLGIHDPMFVPDPGVTSSLNASGPAFSLEANDFGQYFAWGAASGEGPSIYAFNPANPIFDLDYTLTTKEGIQYVINPVTGDARSIRDRNGNTLSFTDSGITSSSGPGITFERDPRNRITAVIDPMGERIEYGYDVNGDLISVTDREDNVTRFEYRTEPAHYLENVIDPLGRTGARSEYNEETGRLERIIDADGQEVRLEYNDDESLQTVYDQLRNPTIFRYDERGNVVEEVDAEGGVTRREYNDPNNPTLETAVTTLLDSGMELRTESTYDSRGNVLSETDPLGNETTFTYNSFNQILTTTDALGNTITNTYDGSGNLLSTTDADGLVTTFTYDSVGNPLTINAGDNVTTFNYDSAGNVIRQEDVAGVVTTFTYDANGNQRTETRKRTLLDGSVRYVTTKSDYDDEGRVIKTTIFEAATDDADSGELLSQTETVYDAVGNREFQIELVDEDSNQKRYARFVYDDRGLLTKTVFPDDDDAQFVDVPDPDDPTRDNNPFTETVYDAAGNVLVEINEAGAWTQFVYDGAGRLVETILPNDDDLPFDRMLGVADQPNRQDNPSTRTVYDRAGRAVVEIDPLGNWTEFVYDAAGNVLQTILPDDDDLQFAADIPRADLNRENNPRIIDTYDKAGRRDTSTDPLVHTTTFGYSDGGRLETTIFHDTTSTNSDFDDQGRLRARTDQKKNTTEFEYDTVGRLKAVIQTVTGQETGDPRELRTEYEYDELGNLTIQRDAIGARAADGTRETRFEYDGLGRRTKAILPDATPNDPSDNLFSTTTYDLVGRLASTTDFNHNTVNFEYDARNRLTKKDFPDGLRSTDTTFTYTDTSQVETITDGRGLTVFEYDFQDRLKLRTDPDGSTIAYEYDAAGNRIQVTTTVFGNTPRVTGYTFDAQNRQRTVTDPEGGVTTYFYDLAGRLERTEFPNNTFETRTYDALNRLLSVETFGPADVLLAGFHYELDAVGNRQRVTEETPESTRVVDYAYDELYRLLGETMYEDVADPLDLSAETADRTISYTYDDVGNRLMRADSDPDEGTTLYEYDAMDRLLTETLTKLAGDVVKTIYGYDNNGNTTSKTTEQNSVVTDQVFYDWDLENRLIAADTNGDGTTDVAYQYDADGIRVSKTGNGATTQFLLDKNRRFAQVLEEYTAGGILKVSYVHGLDLISQNRHAATGKSFYHVDGLGSSRALTNAVGALTDHFAYDAFGRALRSFGATENVYLFTGEQRDFNIGLDYLRARYLDVVRGQFASRDVFDGLLNNPATLHRYLYAGANPVNNVDPSGLFLASSLPGLVVAQAIVVVLLFAAISQTQPFRDSANDLAQSLKRLSVAISTAVSNTRDDIEDALVEIYLAGSRARTEIIQQRTRRIRCVERARGVATGIDVTRGPSITNLAKFGGIGFAYLDFFIIASSPDAGRVYVADPAFFDRGTGVDCFDGASVIQSAVVRPESGRGGDDFIEVPGIGTFSSKQPALDLQGAVEAKIRYLPIFF